MSTAATVLVCALSLLGRSPGKYPPVEFLETAPPGVSAQAEAFVRSGIKTVYLITSSPVFREAADADTKCGGSLPLKKLASILVHEEWHIRNGPDEGAAYRAQLLALHSLGLGPETAVYHSVLKSMRRVLDQQKGQVKPDAVLALNPEP